MKRVLIFSTILLFSSALFSQEAEVVEEVNQADALAKQLQNPVASLISVPFQGNYDFGIGPADGNRFLLNIQPVIPLSISEDWNLIGRIILPVISQNDVFGNSGSQFGLGDALLSGFFSPNEPTPGGVVWGVGPAIQVPTATDNLLGSGKLSVGPTAVILKQAGPITFGALVNHVWSVAGKDNRSDVNNSFLQPFIAKNFAGGYAIAINTELLQNWEADSTVGSFHIIGSKVVTLGKQMAQVFIGPRIPYGNGNSADFGIRGGLTLLFPKG